MTTSAELSKVLDQLDRLVRRGLSHVKLACEVQGNFDAALLDDQQQATAELALSAAELRCARNYLDYAGSRGELEGRLAATFGAEVAHNIKGRLARSPGDYGLSFGELDGISMAAPAHFTSARAMSSLGRQLVLNGGDIGDRGLDEEKLLMADTFRQFANKLVTPLAENIHRRNLTIPDDILDGVRNMGCFGLSVPQRYGGLLPDDREDSLGMIVVTEELSRASLGGAGSLITRPEIMARALIDGGTEEQKKHWLPRLAKGDPLCAIAITEPDYGSDVAAIGLRATKTDDGWLLKGAKAWSTFAGKSGVLLTLARTDPDLALGHRGLSLFMVEKPSFDGEAFEVVQEAGGKLSGQAVPTLGYRGMHSFQLFFDDYFVPAAQLIGEGQGLGRGFYFTMRGFMGGRIQTAARACGVMQAAFEAALAYANDRRVFGKAVADYQLTLIKLARMAMYLGTSRQMTYTVGRLMDQGGGQMEASLVKLLACKLSEWTTREAMQIHGGMGYAEETAASRYWLDARVLSIFEGTEETLALKVVGRRLVEQAEGLHEG